MIKNIIEELKNIIFFLNSKGLTRASQLTLKALELIKSVSITENPSNDVLKTIADLEQKISLLKRCASSSYPNNKEACSSEAKQVYRRSTILVLLITNRIKDLSRARRFAYASIALGLPTSALFGLSPLAIGLIFLGVLWTYIYFIRLKLVGWLVLISSLTLLLPFLINAVLYFVSALFDASELVSISEALGVNLNIALLTVLVFLAISVTSLILNIYSLYKLIKFRSVFE